MLHFGHIDLEGQVSGSSRKLQNLVYLSAFLESMVSELSRVFVLKRSMREFISASFTLADSGTFLTRSSGNFLEAM